MKQFSIYDYEEKHIKDIKTIIDKISQQIFEGHTYGGEVWIIHQGRNNMFSDTKYFDLKRYRINEFTSFKDVVNRFRNEEPYPIVTAFDTGMLDVEYGDTLTKIKQNIGRYFMKHIHLIKTEKCKCCNGTGHVMKRFYNGVDQ